MGNFHMYHAEFGLTAVAFSATVALASTPAQAQAESSGSRTLWDHNGSVMYLVEDGASREFHYSKPRLGMLDAGVRPGALLFRGEINGAQYLGTAYIFNPHCGPIPFEVKGVSLDADERIVLTGQAPRVGRNCRTYELYTTTLEFRRANLTETNSQEPLTAAPPPPAVPSKPELKSDVLPTQAAQVPSLPTAQHARRNEAPSTPKDSLNGSVELTGIDTSRAQIPVPNEAQRAKDLDKYLWGAAFTAMIVWLLIKLFGKTLIGIK
jgi:hypothetical protein